MRSRFLAVAIGAMVAATPLIAQEPTRVPDSAITAAERGARRWFALLTDGNYAASWEQASQYFREHVSREQWMVNAERLERQFHRADLRKLVEARWMQDEPPLPPTEYVVLRWLTVIDEFRQVGERVTMAHDIDGAWRPATYDLFPNVDGVPFLVRDHDSKPPPVAAPMPPSSVAPRKP